MRLLLLLLLVPSVALADIAPPPGGYPAETCILDQVRKPGEDCYTCFGNLSQSESECVPPKAGYTKRCATRRQGTTWGEVWCNVALDAAPVAPAVDAAAKTPPPLRPDAAVSPKPKTPPPAKARDKGCHVAGGGTSGGTVPLIMLLGFVGLLCRARVQEE